ncbi:MAG: aminotransferase class I/II-fold pyridoxal phosphate-dependent enzyme [Selenomonadaceae bacterium]|nr:aminotransferase class I/II-fold pyridoxal phosphate-dependent enzyme [Selenomonadaceae bacterium]
MSMNMAAAHAVNRKLKDAIFEASKACQDAIKIHGAEKVTNATIGVVLDDAGKLAVMPTVEKVFKSMQMSDFTAYAPIAGMADYTASIKEIIFENKTCENFFDAVATSGGTGAIHHAVANYAERGESVLTSDWCWGTYKIICDETGKNLETFKLFNEDLSGFNVESFSDKVEELLKKQNSLLIILNTPAHNPTGYSLNGAEWDKVLEILKSHALKGKKISLLADVAYIEFSADKEIAWAFVDKFKNLPENLLIMLSFSMSKSYTLYGQRTGALAAISSSREVIDEFKETNKFSCRASWSNINHGAQVLLTKINADKNLREELEQDQKKLRETVKNRAEIFVKEANECGLKIVPYRGGFFIAIPAENPVAVAEKLHKDLIFAVPLKLGLRVAACSVSQEKMFGVAQKIKSAIDSTK